MLSINQAVMSFENNFIYIDFIFFPQSKKHPIPTSQYKQVEKNKNHLEKLINVMSYNNCKSINIITIHQKIFMLWPVIADDF